MLTPTTLSHRTPTPTLIPTPTTLTTTLNHPPTKKRAFSPTPDREMKSQNRKTYRRKTLRGSRRYWRAKGWRRWKKTNTETMFSTSISLIFRRIERTGEKRIWGNCGLTRHGNLRNQGENQCGRMKRIGILLGRWRKKGETCWLRLFTCRIEGLIWRFLIIIMISRIPKLSLKSWIGSRNFWPGLAIFSKMAACKCLCLLFFFFNLIWFHGFLLLLVAFCYMGFCSFLIICFAQIAALVILSGFGWMIGDFCLIAALVFLEQLVAWLIRFFFMVLWLYAESVLVIFGSSWLMHYFVMCSL